MLNCALGRDVPEHTRQLIEFLDKNERILTSIDDGVIIFDLDGHAAAANPAAVRLLRQSASEIVGRHINQVIGEETGDGNRAAKVKLPGDDKTLSVSLAPVSDSSGQAICTVAVFHDSDSKARVERIKSSFVSIASHEFRTPLNAILGYIDMLKEDVYGPLTDAQRQAIERAAANTGQLVSLINDLLDRAQMEAGQLSLNVVPFVPRKLVGDVQSAMGMLAESKGLELTLDVADDVPAVLFGDSQRLYQILVNLVSNGIKFTDQGSVHMRVHMPDTDHWVLEVSDTGRGIPDAVQTDIFLPFLQADDPIRREQGGAGLGLSIVQELVALMDGEIEVESKVGRGSTFRVTLPLASQLDVGGDTAPSSRRAP
jgi:signal transduction histidine kinase